MTYAISKSFRKNTYKKVGVGVSSFAFSLFTSISWE